jgi:hypothetical protein
MSVQAVAEASGSSTKKAKAGDGVATTTTTTMPIEVSLFCFDGSTFQVVIPMPPQVYDVKCAIEADRSVPLLTIELFLRGYEDALLNNAQLDSTDHRGLTLFMLTRPSEDQQALAAVWRCTNVFGEWHTTAGWNSDELLGCWHGVHVNEDGRVIRLLLTGNGCTGVIPTELEALGCLTSLSFFSNRLSGGSIIERSAYV